MGIKDWFGFGDKKYPQDYDVPCDRKHDGSYYPEQRSRQQQGIHQGDIWPVGINSAPPFDYTQSPSTNSTWDEMPLENVISFLYPQTKDTKVVSTSNTYTDTSKNTNTPSVDAAPKTIDASEVIAEQDKVAKPKTERPAISKPRKLVILLIENTHDICKRKSDIFQLLNGIFNSQKDALFLLLELGKTNHFLELADFEDIASKDMLKQFLDSNNTLGFSDLHLAFSHINKYLRDKTWPRFEFKDVTYRIDSCDIICIGNRIAVDSAMSNTIVANALTEFSQRTNVNFLKYLRINPIHENASYNLARVTTLTLPQITTRVFRLFKPQTKDIIVFLVENTSSVLGRQNVFVSLLNQIAINQKNALYLLVKVGTSNQYTPLLDYEALSKDKLILDLFDAEISSEQTELADALEQIKKVLVPMLDNKFAFKKVDYLAGSFSFVCIGSGSTHTNENSKKSIASCIKTFTSWKKTNNLKYLCVKDTETIQAAALGFPDIKHIVSDFYI